MNPKEIKDALLEQCEEFIQQRIDVAEKLMQDAQQSANNETKSSAGDKYETGRAMMQMERDKYAQQLSEAILVKSHLMRINPNEIFTEVTLGSVVQTPLGKYFIAISAGRIKVEEDKYFAISPGAPLAQEMMGKKVGEMVTFNDRDLEILAVF